MKNPLLRFAEKYLTEDEPRPGAREATHQPGGFDFHDFQRRFAQLLAQRSDMPMGRINIVTLAELKEKLGPRWAKMEDQVHQTADRVINSHVQPRDIVVAYSPLEYLIVISNAKPEAAQLQCAGITREIYRHFLGEEAVCDVSIRSAVGHDGQDLLFEDVTMSGLKDAALQELEQELEQSEAAAPVKQPLDFVEEDIEWPDVPQFASGQDGEEAETAGPPGVTTFDPDSLEFIYRPMWDIKSEVMSTYLCMPCRVMGHGEIAYRYDVLGQKQPDEARAWIDAMAAREALVMLDDLLRNKFSMFITTSIHYETLASTRLRARVMGMFSGVPDSMKRFLALEIIGVPSGVTSGRMSQMVNYLRPISRVLFVRTDLANPSLQGFAGIGVQAVGFDIGNDNRPEAAVIADINSFAERAAKQQVPIYCQGVRSTSLAIAAAGAGYRFISGNRIASDQTAPMNVLRYNWRDFYVHHDL